MKHAITFILTIILTVMLLCFVVNANIREAYTDLPSSETLVEQTEKQQAVESEPFSDVITKEEPPYNEFNESDKTEETQSVTPTEKEALIDSTTDATIQEPVDSVEDITQNPSSVTDNTKEEASTVTKPEQEESNIQNSTTLIGQLEIDNVDEQLYVSATSLNVRVGPGTEYDKVLTLSLNDQVHRIGIVANGWSLIDHNNQKLYVHSSYLSYQKVVIETPTDKKSVSEEIQSRPGMLGRLSIPSVGLDVALFYGDVRDSSQSQRVVDASDSAAYLSESDEYYGQILIADHVHQGFSAIKQSIPGTTEAIIDFGTHVEKWICTRIFIGMNVGSNLVDMNGIGIEGQNDGGICMYTCNFDGSITITFWQKV